MGKKRAPAVGAVAAPPVFPFPPADAQPGHFSDYGFDDPQLLRHFFSSSHSQPDAKRRPWGRRHHHQQQQQQQQPAHSRPLESARFNFKLQKPISKKHQHLHKLQQQSQRRPWWSSAALFLLNLRRRSSSSGSAAAAPPPPSWSAAAPLYLADADDGGGDDGPAACTCWAPPGVRSGRLAAAELGAAGVSVPYVSLRSTGLGGGGGNARAGGGTPAMPIYLVT